MNTSTVRTRGDLITNIATTPLGGGSVHSADMLDKGLIHTLGEMKPEGERFYLRVACNLKLPNFLFQNVPFTNFQMAFDCRYLKPQEAKAWIKGDPLSASSGSMILFTSTLQGLIVRTPNGPAPGRTSHPCAVDTAQHFLGRD